VSDRQLQLSFSESAPERLDKFLVKCLPDYSRSRLQGLIKDGFVRVNEKAAVKGGQMVDPGDQIEVVLPPPEPAGLIPEAIPLHIIFENNDLIVVNKPAGMVVHPAAGHSSGTLIQAALAHAPELEGIGGEIRPGVVHRLDKDTSGLILIAKNDRSHRWLQDQFRTRKVKKIYLALVDGFPPTPTGRVEAPVGRDPAHRKQMAVVPLSKGRASETEYRTLERFEKHSLLETHPLTGRTHQIRLHLAFIGCPIVGDTLYGHRHPTLPVGRQFLHAGRLDVTLPGEIHPRHFEAPLPDDLAQVLNDLRSRIR
jgi:23S rRNA pseudouridine1911/1915/1917 synthase